MGMDWDENLCVGLFYEHRFAMLIRLLPHHDHNHDFDCDGPGLDYDY